MTTFMFVEDEVAEDEVCGVCTGTFSECVITGEVAVDEVYSVYTGTFPGCTTTSGWQRMG